MKLNILGRIIFLCLALSVISKSQAKADLTVRINENAFPAGFLQNASWQGMDVDVLDALSAKTGLSYQVITMPFKRSISELAKGEIDIVVNLTKNADRREVMNWLGPIRNTKIALVVAKNHQGPSIASIDELVRVLKDYRLPLGKVIGVSYSPFLDGQLQENHQLIAQTWSSATRNQIVEMLRKQRIFGFFQDEFEASSLIQAHKNHANEPYADFVIRPSTIDSSILGAFFGVSKKLNPQTMQKLSTAFAEIQDDGTLVKLYQKWAGAPMMVSKDIALGD
ncbi:MAG: amino acid ABC transporter substrate-binding protein [Paraglaciecola sp.]|nr:amino acid ABC transporter substrate-binding protein [Paraglaciecola sp.]NCT46411.1 amino acid ABC transporter substrate-binding protein [Paraglaciecola sp.]